MNFMITHGDVDDRKNFWCKSFLEINLWKSCSRDNGYACITLFVRAFILMTYGFNRVKQQDLERALMSISDRLFSENG